MKIDSFDYSVNLLQSIIWQYDKATNLTSLINSKQSWYDVNFTQFWQDWYTNVFNLITANTFGLVVWSYILNMPLFLIAQPESPSKPNWGFNSVILSGTVTSGLNTVSGLSSTSNLAPGMKIWDNNTNIPYGTTIATIVDANNITMSANATGTATENITFFLGNGYLNFNNSNFSTKGSVITLTAEQQRFLLRLRFYQLSNRCDVTDVNQFLHNLLLTSNIGYTGTIYMEDNLNMSITYVFTVANFPPNLLTVIKNFDVLPRPAGVTINYSL